MLINLFISVVYGYKPHTRDSMQTYFGYPVVSLNIAVSELPQDESINDVIVMAFTRLPPRPAEGKVHPKNHPAAFPPPLWFRNGDKQSPVEYESTSASLGPVPPSAAYSKRPIRDIGTGTGAKMALSGSLKSANRKGADESISDEGTWVLQVLQSFSASRVDKAVHSPTFNIGYWTSLPI